MDLDGNLASGERGPTLRTQRLVLRRWRPEDCAPFARLNADPEVMEHFQKRLTRAESDAFVIRIEAEFDECGFGLWAVEVPGRAEFIGYVGLHRVPFDARFTPAVEIGWRVAREHWGCGYATEAARAAVRYGFDDVGLDEIVSFTTPGNVRSWKVMERLGMVRDPDSGFEHPNVPVGHPLRSHVLYRFPHDQELQSTRLVCEATPGSRRAWYSETGCSPGGPVRTLPQSPGWNWSSGTEDGG